MSGAMTMLQPRQRQKRFLQYTLWALASTAWLLSGGLLLCAADQPLPRPVALRLPALASPIDLSTSGAETSAPTTTASNIHTADPAPVTNQKALRQAVRQRRLFSVLGLTRTTDKGPLSRLPQVSAETVSQAEPTSDSSPVAAKPIATSRAVKAKPVRVTISDLTDKEPVNKESVKKPASPPRLTTSKITPLPAVAIDIPAETSPPASLPIPSPPKLAKTTQTKTTSTTTPPAPAIANPSPWPALRQPLHIAPHKSLAIKQEALASTSPKNETPIAEEKPAVKTTLVEAELAKTKLPEQEITAERQPTQGEPIEKQLAENQLAESKASPTEPIQTTETDLVESKLAEQKPIEPAAAKPVPSAVLLASNSSTEPQLKTTSTPKITVVQVRQPLAEKSSLDVPLGPVRQTQFAQPRTVQTTPFVEELDEPETPESPAPIQQVPVQQAPIIAPQEPAFSVEPKQSEPEQVEPQPSESDPRLAHRRQILQREVAGPEPFEIVDSSGDMQVQVRRSKLIIAKHDLFRTAVVDPNICDVIQYTPREASIIGKQVGATHVTFWFEGENQRPITYLITVSPDPQAAEKLEQEYMLLENLLARLFPDSKVRLLLAADKLIVRGQAKDSEEATQIMAIIRNQAIGGGLGIGGGGGGQGGSLRQGTAAQVLGDDQTGGGQRRAIQVINMLRVPGVQQVALRVKIAELNRSAARGFGVDIPNAKINLSSNNNGSQLVLQSILNAATGNAPALLAQFDGDDIQLGVRYLEQHGVLRLLSEPTLVTMSGQPATFVAGGEFAVPTVVGNAGLNAVTTDFRAFGVIISFLPTVIDKDRIRLQVAPEFSQINSDLTVGNTPGLNVRAVTTTVEMREGQTLAIAGLLEDTMKNDDVNNVPFLSRVFGSRDATRNETELIILVTPELIHPMEAEETPPLPGFDVTEPTNGQFFLGGRLEGTPTLEYRSTVWPRLKRRYKSGGSSMISGPFGHGQ